MAVEGVRFDNAITQNPICTPSRVSWLSGQYCHNHGYYGLSGPKPNGLPTILGHFRRFGYRTGAVGKIHCPEYWVEDDCDFFHDTCGTSIDGRSRKYARHLEERGLTNLEDHGDYACEHGVLEKAPGICSDAITRIPWLWCWPGHFKTGHKADELVETVDLVNTLCALADIDPLETADGKDISHLLRGENGEVHRVGVTEFAWSKSLRKGKYRLVYYPPEMFPGEYPDGFGELYDLEADPWEMKNLYFEADFQEVVQDLERELIRWLITTTRPATVHPLKVRAGYQTITRYHHSVNADGKINPENIKPIAGSNYV